MKNGHLSLATLRREQIVDAAVAVIAEQGIQNLSLSEIEKKVGMSRGQLTYYFKTKEDILLAVFDRLVEQWRQRGCPEDSEKRHPFGNGGFEEVVGWILRRVVDP